MLSQINRKLLIVFLLVGLLLQSALADARPKSSQIFLAGTDEDLPRAEEGAEDAAEDSKGTAPLGVRRGYSTLLHGDLLEKGQLSWRTTDILLHEVEYGLSDDVTLGSKTVLPLGFVALAPTLRKREKTLGDEGSVFASAAVIWPYADMSAVASLFAGKVVMANVGAQTCWRYDRFVVGTGISAYALRYGNIEQETRFEGMDPVVYTRTYFDNHLFLVPSATLDMKLGESLTLHTEVHVPLGDFDGVGRTALIGYGLQLNNEASFLNLSFMRIQHPGLSSFNAALPTGIPMVSAGLQL